VKDEQLFNEDRVNSLIQAFSYISVAGILFSVVAGHCLDTMGSSQTNMITCFLGIAQMMLVLCAYSQPGMVASFGVYGLFRSFLYPCFFSGLATSFGFRFYGALSGIVVALSGVVFIAFVPFLSDYVIGTCHAVTSKDGCLSGRWRGLHVAQIVSLLLLFLMEVAYREDERSDSRDGQDPKESDGNVKVHNYGSVQDTELRLVHISPKYISDII